MSSLQDFYTDQTIFITGGTGFLGQLLLEKLLRTCPNFKKIYLLVREKPNKNIDQRLNDIFNSPIFDSVKSENSDFLKKIGVLNGDCSLPVLGLSSEAQEILKNEVSCIFHAAANVRFDIDLKSAVHTNVRSVRDLMDLMKEMKMLKAFVYVSTGFSHCYRKNIGEEFYDVDIKPEKLLQMVDILDNKTLDAVTPHIMDKWPNTYVYTKAIAEEVIRSCKQVLPVAIVRPVIVISTYKEPIPGWISNFHGAVGVILGASLGVLRSIHLDKESTAFLVPADYVVNSILASAWNVDKSRKEQTDSDIPIYNCSIHKSNTRTWGFFIKFLMQFAFVYPLSASVWYHYFQTSRYLLIHKIRVFFYHTLFAYMVDSILFVAGKRTLAVEKYRKINKLTNLLSYFTTNHFNIETENTVKLWEKLDDKDKELFDFNTKKLEWNEYLVNCIIGGRVHLLKDPLDTIPQARKKMYFLRFIHYVFVGFVLYFWYWLLSPVFKLFF